MMKAISAQTCVDAWMQACEHLLTHDEDDWRAYNVVIEVDDALALPAAERAVLSVLDGFLTQRGGLPINSVVNTIFPAQLYARHGAKNLYARYLTDVYPQVKKHPDWQWGTYAQRIFSRLDRSGVEFNPLDVLINKMRAQVESSHANRGAYELGIMEPMLDIPIYDPDVDRNRPIGGPCLTHMSVKLTSSSQVMLTGFYRSHFYIQRALGNLMGLAHLQNFIAAELGLKRGALICHSSLAILELKSKKKMRPSHEKWGRNDVRDLLERCRVARNA
jgi:hypothetical protein